MQRRYIEMNYPILHDRMRGVAAAFGKRLDDDGWNFSRPAYLFGPPPGCSVVYRVTDASSNCQPRYSSDCPT